MKLFIVALCIFLPACEPIGCSTDGCYPLECEKTQTKLVTYEIALSIADGFDKNIPYGASSKLITKEETYCVKWKKKK